MPNLLEKLEKAGYNRDLEISEKMWRKEKEEKEHRDSRSLAALEHRNEPTYRDSKAKKSIELKDYRNRKYNADFIAELEHYNPDHHPAKHALIDFPNWLWKNRIKKQGPKNK
jgi:hypothetical protein